VAGGGTVSGGPHDWLGHVQPTGLVVAPAKLDELGLAPLPQHQADNDAVKALLGEDERSLPDAWPFLSEVLGWPESRVAGASGGPPLPEELTISLRDGETILSPTYAVRTADGESWQLLVRVEGPDVVLDRRGALDGWEATPHQRFERLLRETGIGAGVLIGARATGRRDDDVAEPELRLVVAPKGETSGWIAWPLPSLATVAGREMLGGLKMLLDRSTLWTNPPQLRLPNILAESRASQADVSKELSGQVLAALHELLRGFDAADPALVRELAGRDPHQLYEGLLTVLMRLIFILYAEDRSLMPSVTAHGGAELYERGYSVGGLFVKLGDDEALYPDTMDERRGGWGRLLALFRLVSRGHDGFMQRRGGRLFDEERFPFLLGKGEPGDPERVLPVSDGCILRVLTALMTLERRGTRERLSYRTLDVEQIGSVYETVMGFIVDTAAAPMLAIKAGKNNKVPVFVDLAALVADKPADRPKRLKEDTGRGQFPAAVARAVRDAEDLASMAAALAPIADPRGSPRQEPVGHGTPILQPTNERRRTGSHYTPRSLTAPIVTHALEPAFERIGADATPAQVLDLKVCDPAVGSGAFLVEACRQLGTRLVQAWEAHPALKPPIPADEDDELHARRLVARRCLYGVDRNPMALDLAKLSLWLATLARDHEFSFLDHALKAGDSLVGLTRAQIESASWEENAAPGLWRARVRQDVGEALAHRDAIRNAPDEVALAMQEAQHDRVERGLANVRLIGDAVIATFFAHDRARARRDALAEVGDRAGGGDWEWLRQRAMALEGGAHRVRPFHWEIEFPEVFAREDPGFDAMVGNPPFLGGTWISGDLGTKYLAWLTREPKTGGRADLVAYFFRRAFSLMRESGRLGFIATNSIAQGDTRMVGLSHLRGLGGTITSAIRRMPWPGEAAVVVSVVHVSKENFEGVKYLDGRPAKTINSQLFDVDFEGEPHRFLSNNIAYKGYDLYGVGFTFDDMSQSGLTGTMNDMRQIMAEEPHSADFIRPYIGGSEVNTDPRHQPHRFAVNVSEFETLADAEAVVPVLMSHLKNTIAVERQSLPNNDRANKLKERWWVYNEVRPNLTRALAPLEEVIVCSQVSPHLALTFTSAHYIISNGVIIFVSSARSAFATLQSRIHEVWARFFASSMKDDLRYTPSDCFETFPLPPGFEDAPALETAGRAYHDHRASLMIARDQGMTKTYNRFHDSLDTAEEIAELRHLHAAMDEAVLRAYGWDDLADRAVPEFLTEETEDDYTYQGRLFWPAPFRDELLARLLKLNEERATEERQD
jgi:hypothetical protein